MHLRLRAITLRFFERGLGSLALLRKAMEDFPNSIKARQAWVQEIRVFADRAQTLAGEWEKLYPELKGHVAGETEAQNRHEDTPTPVV